MRSPSKLVLAVPVAPTDTLAAMREETDEVICLEDYEFFGAIGLHYSDFSQTSDQEVIAPWRVSRLLTQSRQPIKWRRHQHQ